MILKCVFSSLVLFALTACGVKADPQAPLAPTDIGHGKPLYKNEDDTSRPLRKIIPNDEEQKSDQDSDDSQ